MTLFLGRVWIPLVAILYVAFAALQTRPGSWLAYFVVLASPFLFVVWRRTVGTERGVTSTEPGALQAARAASAAALLWLAARAGPPGHPAFDAVANFATGCCTLAALVALARIAAPGGLLTAPKMSRSLDGAVFAGFLWSVATCLPVIRTLVSDSALRIDPITIDYATLTASLSSVLLILAVAARLRWLRKLELGVGDRASGAVTVSIVSLLLAVPVALLNIGAPDRIVPEVLVGMCLAQCWVATTGDAARIVRWLRGLIALLALGAPAALLGFVIAQSHTAYTGWVVIAVASWSATVGILARTIAKPLEPEQSRWLSAIDKATHSALEPDPNDAMRFALNELSQLNPNGKARPELWCIDPAEAKYVDVAGQLHERAAKLPERLTELAALEPELTLRLEVLRAVQVRRPEVRPLVSWFENQGTFSATLLQSGTGPVGVVCLPTSGRRAPLTLEEGTALHRLGSRIGAILAVSAAQARSRQRELAALRNSAVVEESYRILKATAEAEHDGYRKLTESWASAVRRFAYSPESRMVLEQVERTARTMANQVLVVPAGVDVRGWAAIAHLASPRANGPLFLVDSMGEPESIQPWQTVAAPDDSVIPGNLALLEPLGLDLETQQRIANWIAGSTSDTNAKFGCILMLRSSMTDLLSSKLISESLARRFGDAQTSIPTLARRSEDLRAMILDKTARLGLSLRGEPSAVDIAVLDELLNYEWPGNESELESVLQLLVQQSSDALIRLEDLERIGFQPAVSSESTLTSAAPPVVHRPPHRRIAHRQR